MNPKNVTISLLSVLALTTALSVWLIDKTKGDWGITLLGLISSNVQILSVFYLVYQLCQIRRETEIIKEVGIETKRKVAELADLNIRTLQKIEAGQTNILVTTAMRLRAALGCRWESLMPH